MYFVSAVIVNPINADRDENYKIEVLLPLVENFMDPQCNINFLFQTLKDEHQALQMAFTALEEKYRKVQDENSELMARWLTQKMKEADIMNQENDRFFK
jgi:autophagy-related protein 16